MEDKADVDMDTEAPQVSHKPGGEPKIKVGHFQSRMWRKQEGCCNVCNMLRKLHFKMLIICLLSIQNVVHELRITNQVIYLNPPIEDCRYKLYQEMFAWKMVILSLPRIQSQRYQVGIIK